MNKKRQIWTSHSLSVWFDRIDLIKLDEIKLRLFFKNERETGNAGIFAVYLRFLYHGQNIVSVFVFVYVNEKETPRFPRRFRFFPNPAWGCHRKDLEYMGVIHMRITHVVCTTY